ncbi:MAG: hypothetical protein ACPGJS_00805 [Flammeovirgaceae bacterium]
MKLSKIHYILFLFVVLSCAQKTETIPYRGQSDWKDMKLNGKVKSMKVQTYKAVDNFGELSKGEKQWGRSYNEYYVFNTQGYIVEEGWFIAEDSLGEKGISKYDDQGYKVLDEWYGANAELNSYTEFTYSETRDKYEMTRFDADKNLLSKTKFHDTFNSLETIVYNASGAFEGKSEWEYDDDRNPLKWIIYGENGLVEAEIILKRDHQGRLIDHRHTADNKVTQTFYSYENHPYPISQSSERGTLKFEWTYEYEFDELGNWIKRLSKLNGKGEFIVEREIVYY